MGRSSWRLAQYSQKCPLRENVRVKKKKGVGGYNSGKRGKRIRRCYSAGFEDEGWGNESRNADAF